MTAPVKRSIVVAGHQTSISLEKPFWEALAGLAKSRDMSLNKLVTEIDRHREGNLSSTLRVYVLKSLQEQNK
ncbi:MAG: aryl-sulfate sulfotransferase [Alphaproteobacteria bacterium]|nr:aryl-sulfate sulfotransferase [Alphaproteobacteria bacterium]